MKLGRKPRGHDPRIPHYSALVAGRRLSIAPPPPAVDHITPCGTSAFGMMGNDTLGDCTCAAVGHADQIASGCANPPMITVADSSVISLYSGACGYVVGNPKTDQGGDEQSVLNYWMLNGIQKPDGTLDKLIAFVEVDPSNTTDIKQTILECGVCYIGFNVPDYAMQSVGQLWDVAPGQENASVVGGHAVVLAAYDDVGPTCITWGAPQKMSWAFFTRWTDEAYAPAIREWVETTGQTPAGLTLDQLEAQMSALREQNA